MLFIWPFLTPRSDWFLDRAEGRAMVLEQELLGAFALHFVVVRPIGLL